MYFFQDGVQTDFIQVVPGGPADCNTGYYTGSDHMGDQHVGERG